MGVSVSSEALGRIDLLTDYDALTDRQLVIEAVVEDETAKEEIFALLGRVVKDPAAVLASNTSSIPIMKLAMASERPQAVIGMHFFNPVPVLWLMELVPTLLTAPESVARAETFAREALGRHVIRSKDRAGFIVNALVSYILSSIRMLESGFATRDEIDSGMIRGCNHPMGPLALADHWPRHADGGRPVTLRRIQRAALRAAAPALPHGGGRTSGSQDGARIP